MKILGKNLFPVFGEPLDNAVNQLDTCLSDDEALYGALMGDHHLGYSMPIGGVVAYKGVISPSGVGYDISCGNCAVMTDAHIDDIHGNIESIMDDVYAKISFGVGRKNNKKVDNQLFDSDLWSNIDALRDLKQMAADQLGTVGSGNHYVDIFHDEEGRVWVGCHFGSRGLGHKIASHYIAAGGGVDSINAKPTLLDVNSQLGYEYIQCMNLAGDYAYAGRDWVCQEVLDILGANELKKVHNHHNFAWLENHFGEDLWVVRKGATPAFPGQEGFVGGTMGENSVILEGVDSDLSKASLYSTVHGAGRIMSRTQATGRSKWKKGKKVKLSDGLVSQAMMDEWVVNAGVCLRGAGTDESPHCYKRLNEVLAAQGDTIKINHVLTPIGVAMAGDEFDPYKD